MGLLSKFTKFNITHVLRGKNELADSLASQAAKKGQLAENDTPK
jgi:ribonuclease HI